VPFELLGAVHLADCFCEIPLVVAAVAGNLIVRSIPKGNLGRRTHAGSTGDGIPSGIDFIIFFRLLFLLATITAAAVF
jgi:hypothetical protein